VTESEQIAYWRKYAKQNAKMERLAYRIMLRAINDGLSSVYQSVLDFGPEVTLFNLDALFTRKVIQKAYEQLYYEVGVRHKKWADADVKARFPRKKEEDDRIRRRPNPAVAGIESNFGVGFFNPAWLARLKQIVNDIETIERVNSVKSTITKAIRKSISSAQQEYISIRKIIARVKSDFTNISHVSAERIARTEVTYISNIAAEQSANETGLDLVKAWVRTMDHRTRDTHVKAPRSPIKSTDKFLVGGKKMDKPGDPAGGLKEIINCRCVVAYFPADDYEDLLNDQGEFHGFS